MIAARRSANSCWSMRPRCRSDHAQVNLPRAARAQLGNFGEGDQGNAKRSETQLSPFRSFEFDNALILLFDVSYAVVSATIVAADLIRSAGRQSSHVNGSIVRATSSLLSSGLDVSARFRSTT